MTDPMSDAHTATRGWPVPKNELPADLRAVVDAWSSAASVDIVVPSHCILAASVLHHLWPERCQPRSAAAFYANNLAQSFLPGIGGRRIEEMSPDAWTVGIVPGVSGPAEPNAYDGHVVIIADDRWLIDLAAAQFDRPDRGIRSRGPFVATVDEGEPSEMFTEAGRQFNLRDHGGLGWAHYALIGAELDDEGWRGAPDWRFPSRREHIIRRLVELGALS